MCVCGGRKNIPQPNCLTSRAWQSTWSLWKANIRLRKVRCLKRQRVALVLRFSAERSPRCRCLAHVTKVNTIKLPGDHARWMDGKIECGSRTRKKQCAAIGCRTREKQCAAISNTLSSHRPQPPALLASVADADNVQRWQQRQVPCRLDACKLAFAGVSVSDASDQECVRASTRTVRNDSIAARETSWEGWRFLETIRSARNWATTPVRCQLTTIQRCMRSAKSRDCHRMVRMPRQNSFKSCERETTIQASTQKVVLLTIAFRKPVASSSLTLDLLMSNRIDHADLPTLDDHQRNEANDREHMKEEKSPVF